MSKQKQSKIPRDALRLWLLIKDSMINHEGNPTREQVRQLIYVLKICELAFCGTVNVDGMIKLLIEVGLNPLTNLEGIDEIYDL